MHSEPEKGEGEAHSLGAMNERVHCATANSMERRCSFEKKCSLFILLFLFNAPFVVKMHRGLSEVKFGVLVHWKVC